MLGTSRPDGQLAAVPQIVNWRLNHGRESPGFISQSFIQI